MVMIRKILLKLNSTMTDSEIGKVIGAPQSTVTRLRNGTHKSTSYERGLAIMRLAESRGVDLSANETASES
jgi:hypothetical protein